MNFRLLHAADIRIGALLFRHTANMNHKTLSSLSTLLAIFLCTPFVAGQESGKVNFTNDILPILESNCVSCHGPEDPKGGYRIDNRDEALDYIETGDAENSEFYQYLISDNEEEMMPPPDEGGPLDDSDIALIKTWINEGAAWPEGLTLAVAQDGSDDIGDVSTTTGEDKDQGPNIYRAIGTLHPAAIHLPIGLLLAAGFFALLSLRGNFIMSDCAYYCLWLGTFGAVIACLTGWWFVLDQHPSEYVSDFDGLQDMSHKLFWHRTSGLAATLFALLLALFAASARNRDPDDGVAWKLGLILLAAGIGYVGHQGGKLTWKASHYDELYEVIDQFVPGFIPQEEADESDSNDANAETKEMDSQELEAQDSKEDEIEASFN